MARAAIKLSVADLAIAASLRPSTISHFEGGGDSRRSTVDALQRELEARGVVFVAAGEASIAGGAGVRMKAGPE